MNGTSCKFFTKRWFVLQERQSGALAPVLTGLLSLTAMLLRH
jgi:hypothetical protein